MYWYTVNPITIKQIISSFLKLHVHVQGMISLLLFKQNLTNITGHNTVYLFTCGRIDQLGGRGLYWSWGRRRRGSPRFVAILEEGPSLKVLVDSLCGVGAARGTISFWLVHIVSGHGSGLLWGLLWFWLCFVGLHLLLLLFLLSTFPFSTFSTPLSLTPTTLSPSWASSTFMFNINLDINTWLRFINIH